MATVLIVDDHAINRELLVTLLRYQGHDLLEAADGAEALGIIKSQRPQLVITDILMPTMDGYELVRRVRADPQLANTAVIFYTAHFRSQEAHELAKRCGVSHVLTKPAEPDVILSTIADALAVPMQAAPPPRDFDEEHLRVVTDKLSQTVDELRAANERLAALIDISLELASEREPHKLLDTVCAAARNLIGSQYALLAVGDADEPVTRYHSVAGMDSDTAARITGIALDSGMPGRAYQERKARRAMNPSGDPQTLGLPAGHPPARCVVVAPVVSLKSVYGWLCLTGKVGGDAFSDEDERLLGILAAEVGRIHESGTLYREVRQHAARLQSEIEERKLAQEKIRRLNRVYAVLSRINTLIVRVTDRTELFSEACRIAVDEGNFAIAWIGSVERDSMRVTPIASAGGEAQAYLGSIKGSLADSPTPVAGLLRGAVSEGRAHYSNDLAAERDQSSDDWREQAVRRGYQSGIVLPLFTAGKVVGNLSLFSTERNFFDEKELQLLDELAGDISFALDHLATEERLDYLAYYDSLTGLQNHTLFTNKLASALPAVRQGGRNAAVIIADVKHFRWINDSLGWHAGDALLRELSMRLRALWSESGQVARISGDRFGVALTDIQAPSDVAHQVERRITQALAAPFKINGHALAVALAIGIAMFPNDGDNAETLLRNAEAALRKAKASGERYVFYQPEMNASVAHTLMLESRLRTAIEGRQFVLHYQPKLALQSNEICGVEALIRWEAQDSQSGPMSPTEFIPLLEETGMIVDAGRWVIGKALEDHREWSQLGLKPPRVAVNVSPIQLRQKDFVDIVREAVNGSAGAGAGLDLEITESLLMEDVDNNFRKLRAIRDMGVDIAIDDFGTGYSSLRYLAQFPVTALKIDRSFIVTMVHNPDSMTIVSTIISLGRALGLKVIAEGVDSEEQSKFLRLLKCDEIQGFLFSKPLPRSELANLLRQQRHLNS